MKLTHLEIRNLISVLLNEVNNPTSYRKEDIELEIKLSEAKRYVTLNGFSTEITDYGN